MDIFKVSVKNKDLPKMDAMYFQEKETAEAFIATINGLLAKGKKIIWECEIINVLSHEEALEQCLDGFKNLKKNDQ